MFESVRDFFAKFRRKPVAPAVCDPMAAICQGFELIKGELELVEQITTSGMAVVWKGRNRKRNKDVVVKIPRNADPIYLVLLATEVESSKTLKHDNIVEVYGLGNNESLFFIEEELIIGQDFETWRLDQTHWCFPWHTIKDYTIQVGKALAYAHSQKICHRDIKPSNIMRADITGRPSVAKVIDFGIASRSHIAGNRLPVSTGSHTMDYASPAQIGGAEGTFPDDVYSFCATFYHLLTGCRVFEGIPGDPEHHTRYTPAPDPNKRLEQSEVSFRIPQKVVDALLIGLRKDVGGAKGRPTDIMRIVRLMETASAPTLLLAAPQRWECGKKSEVRLASSGLIVIECLRHSLALNEFLERAQLEVNTRLHPWDSTILQKINDRIVDGAIVNAWGVRQFINHHPSSDLEVVCSCRHSMGGECFYLIGLATKYPSAIPFAEIKPTLTNKTIFVNDLPEHKAAVDAFLDGIMTSSERQTVRVCIIESMEAVQALETEPSGLVYCGQNFRLLARQTPGQYTEIIDAKSCQESLGKELRKFTENCFVINKKFGEFVGTEKLKKHCLAAQENFARKCKKPKDRQRIVEEISSAIPEAQFEETEIQEAIQMAILRTFPV
jgi:serine/threonine protein kinase